MFNIDDASIGRYTSLMESRHPTGADLKHLRESAGLTQAAAARMCRVGLRAWQRWESGQRAIDLAHYELLLIKVCIATIDRMYENPIN